MHTAQKNPAVPGYAGLHLNADAYLDLAETEDRYELVNGVVVMSPSPTTRHQRIALLLALQLENWAESSEDIHVIPDVDIRLSSDKVFRPDIVAYRRTRMPAIPARLILPPDLIVEVLSPGSESMDLSLKRDAYDRFGVAEYWVVDPRDVRVRCWQWQEGQLVEVAVESTVIVSSAIPGLTVDLTRIRQSVEVFQL